VRYCACGAERQNGLNCSEGMERLLLGQERMEFDSGLKRVRGGSSMECHRNLERFDDEGDAQDVHSVAASPAARHLVSI
jgi:hypothetical protein